MKIELTSDELREALLPYLETFFTKPIKDIYDLDVGCISMEIEFGSEEDNEPEEEKPTKRRRTRKKEVQLDLVEEIEKLEEKEEIGTHYANLPKLSQEEQSQYVRLLELLGTNPRNKNRVLIEELIASGTDNLKTVAKANEHYQDWLKYCEEQDIQKAQEEMLSETEQVEESNTEPEEEKPKTSLELMKEVIAETPDESINENKSLFQPNANVQKSGSFFSSNAGKRVF